MAYLEWSDRYSVDILEVDAHHRKLFDLLNALHGALGPGREAAALAALEAYSDFTGHHTEAEERLLAPGPDADAAAHRHEHTRSLHEIQALRREIAAGRQTLGLSAVGFLADRLIAHVLGDDKRLYAALDTAGVARARQVFDTEQNC